MSDSFMIEKKGYIISFIGTESNVKSTDEIELSEFSDYEIKNKNIQVRLLHSIDSYSSIFTNDEKMSYLIETLLRVEKYKFNLKWKSFSFMTVMIILLLILIPLIGSIQSLLFRIFFYVLLTLFFVTCAFIVTRKNTKVSFDFKKSMK